jgi:hypothetical protein
MNPEEIGPKYMAVLVCLKKTIKIINCNKILIYNKYVHKSREPDKRSVLGDQARLQSPSGPFHVLYSSHEGNIRQKNGYVVFKTEIASDQLGKIRCLWGEVLL